MSRWPIPLKADEVHWTPVEKLLLKTVKAEYQASVDYCYEVVGPCFPGTLGRITKRVMEETGLKKTDIRYDLVARHLIAWKQQQKNS